MIHAARHSAFLAFPLSAALLMGGCDSRAEPPIDATRSSTPKSDTTPPASPSAPHSSTSPAQSTQHASTPPSRDSESAISNTALSDDARILSLLHKVDQDEVRIGKLAQGKAMSADAKAYADMLVKDHTDHDSQVMSIAKSTNITLMAPAAPAGDDPAAILGPLSGAAFDKKFGELMAKGHQDVIQSLEAAQPKLVNPEVKTLAEKTLPVLRHHMEMAQKIAAPSASMPVHP